MGVMRAPRASVRVGIGGAPAEKIGVVVHRCAHEAEKSVKTV